MNRDGFIGFVIATVVPCIVAGGVAAAQDHAAPPDDEVSAEAFVEWAREAAIPVNDWEPNAALEAYLDQALAGRRIVLIGEPGHFFREKYDVQLMLIELLEKRGYRHLFIEGLGAAGSEIVNDFVSSDLPMEPLGDDPTVEEAYRARVLGNDVTPTSTDFQRRLAGAQRRFFEALQRHNMERPEAAEPLSVHPCDIDMAAGGCRLLIDALLARYEDDPKARELRARCARDTEAPVQGWLAQLEGIKAEVDADPDAWLAGLSDPDRDRLEQCLDCVVESVAFALTRTFDGTMDAELVRREPAMYRQVKADLDRLPPDAKVIMMAHSNHVALVAGDTMRAARPSVGEMLLADHPGEVFSIWMLHDHGWLLNPIAPEPLEELKSDPENLASLLARAGSTFVLPIRTGAPAERYLDEKRRVSYFTWFEAVTLPRQADAVFFIDKITPLEPYEAGGT